MSCFSTQKPLSTDEALDSLSAGFMSSTTPAAGMQPEVRFLKHVAVPPPVPPPVYPLDKPPYLTFPVWHVCCWQYQLWLYTYVSLKG